MKRLLFLVIAMIFTVTTINADIVEPGVTDELDYKEVVFLSGEPIELSGERKITESKSGLKKKLTYEYTLNNTEKKASLNRKVVFYESPNGDITIDPKFSETVTIGTTTYTLEDYILSKSKVKDDKDIIKYGSGFFNAKKRYSYGNTNEVIINITGDSYSYENYWSNVNTGIINQTITYRIKGTNSKYSEMTGSVDFGVSESSYTDIINRETQPSYISFSRAYMLKKQSENTVTYKYDMPKLTQSNSIRLTGEGSFTKKTMPTLTSLPVVKYTDIDGYWAKEDIERLASIGVIGSDSGYFNPLSFVNRAEFAKAIVNACGLLKSTDAIKTKIGDAKEKLSYVDVDTNDPNYIYIKEAVDKGIMNGVDVNRFTPDSTITKAMAVTIIIRALGLENIDIAPNTESFADDNAIPLWAKKSLYVARDMGIIGVNEHSMIQPNKILTRGECANLINNFIIYLQKSIKTDYKDRILNFR